MITLRKLSSLPEETRRRKLPRILDQLEQAIDRRQTIPGPYLLGLLTLVARGDWAPPTRQRAADLHRRVKESGFGQGFAAIGATSGIRYEMNTLRHELQSQVGRQAADWDFHQPGLRDSGSEERRVLGFDLYLDGIRSPFNVGSLFRTAESFGVRRIYLSETVPSPEHPRARRTAMGCVEAVSWEYQPLEEAAEGRTLFALETGGRDIKTFPFPSDALAVIGSEELGVSPRGLALAEESLGRVTIPLAGAKGSLNVAVASGILLHHWYSRIG